MSAATQPLLQAGRVYRTRDLTSWTANASRLARRLVQEGQLVPLAHGLFSAPERSRFGAVPPTDQELMRAFLDGADFVFTGPELWNALGLGTSAVFATRLVYNTKRSGSFEFAGRRFQLRRVAFPPSPPTEWFVVDLFENAHKAGASPEALAQNLQRALRHGVFDRQRLDAMTRRYASRATASLINAALEASTT